MGSTNNGENRLLYRVDEMRNAKDFVEMGRFSCNLNKSVLYLSISVL